MDIEEDIKTFVQTLNDNGYKYMLVTLKQDINLVGVAAECNTSELAVMLLNAIKQNNKIALAFKCAVEAYEDEADILSNPLNYVFNGESEITLYDKPKQ